MLFCIIYDLFISYFLHLIIYQPLSTFGRFSIFVICDGENKVYQIFDNC